MAGKEHTLGARVTEGMKDRVETVNEERGIDDKSETIRRALDAGLDQLEGKQRDSWLLYLGLAAALWAVFVGWTSVTMGAPRMVVSLYSIYLAGVLMTAYVSQVAWLRRGEIRRWVRG